MSYMGEEKNIYDKMIESVLANEGFYSNDPDDPGGETIFGISRVNNPNWEGWAVVDNAKETGKLKSMLDDAGFISAVKSWYRKNYWDRMSLDKIAEVDETIALRIFDAAVNIGVGTVSRWVQRCANLLVKRQHLIAVDGIIGLKTVEAIRSLSASDLDVFMHLFNGLQVSHYISIAEKRDALKKYIRGWIAARTLLKDFRKMKRMLEGRTDGKVCP